MVTGGAGFLGRPVVGEIRALGASDIFVPRSRDFDLRDGSAVRRALSHARPEVVVHLAAVVGGIGANRKHPARFFYDNAMMGIQLVHECWSAGIDRVVVVGTVCAYPKNAPVPFREEDLWAGYPEETNAPYGLAKKMLLVQAQAYREEYGFDAVYLLPTNLYGEGDNFDPASSHVIPALIRKCVEAREAEADEIEVWGTGAASRDFLYVGDAARAIAAATDRYDGPEPINIGSGDEVTIGDLVGLITDLTGFRGHVRWDGEKPDGQPRRRLDVERARRLLAFEPSVPLREGLRHTIDWYLSNRATLDAGSPVPTAP